MNDLVLYKNRKASHNQEKTSFVVAWDQTATAGSVPRMGLQARMSEIESYRRAVADNTEVRQKPKLPGFRVSIDFFKFRIEIGVRGDGKIRQWKGEPVTGGLQKSFLTRPAGEEARQAKIGGQRLKSGAFAERKEALGQ